MLFAFEILYSVCTYTQVLQIRYGIFGSAVEHHTSGRADMGSSFIDRNEPDIIMMQTFLLFWLQLLGLL